MEGLIALVMIVLGVAGFGGFVVECIRRRKWGTLVAGLAMVVAGYAFWMLMFKVAVAR